jgi:hypothetical protein
MTSMDRTESTVRNLLTAIEAPLYDVGVLSERGMLPGLDGISAALVLDRLSLLKYRNAHGSVAFRIVCRSLSELFVLSGQRPGRSFVNCYTQAQTLKS